MKAHRILTALVALAAVLCLSGCGTPVERRIRKNPEAFSRLNQQDKAAVMAGAIREGMDKTTVLLAWGPPERVSEGKRNGRSYERWTYVEFDAVMNQPYGPPYGRHGYYDAYDPLYSARPMITYIPHDAAFVEFVGDTVTAWATPKR
jgi:hypothetical protein